jgi:dTDP-4-amino-4,6-dideoxygalactose transaminase
MLEFNVELVKTDYGLIDLNNLDKKLKEKKYCAFIYSNPAGYFAEQPIEAIYEICKKNNCLVILDVTGSIGSELCNGSFADFTVGSFGKWKPVNLGYGGFLSTKKKEFFEKPKEIFNTASFDENYATLLCKKLENVKKRYELFDKINKKIKKDLKSLKILHKDKRGINVIVKFSNESEKNSIIAYCIKNNYQFTICPRYIRVNENAISIEVKREE